MNSYLITCGDKVYATNADNLMDAEEKFEYEYGDEYMSNKTRVRLIETVEEMGQVRVDEEIIVF